MPLATGQFLKDRYRIVRLLGQGGFGAVYRAWDTVLERPCALKENLDPSPAAERQFQREARLLARLKHPNLPDVKDYFILPGQGQYLVMDFVEGDDLEELLAQAGGRLLEEQVLAWIEQICRALEYLHSQNPPVIHRDIKPANIKITPQGQALLVDFGIAKVSDPALGTLSGARAATPGYAPFEQYGQEPTDARSDIYSLGATLYTLLTGQPPLESIARIKGRTLLNPGQLNPHITPGTAAAILKALALHPDQRFQNVSDLRTSLSLEGKVAGVRDEVAGVMVAPTVQVTPPVETPLQPLTTPAPAPSALPASLPRWAWLAGAGLLLAACLLGGFFILSSLISPPSTPSPVALETTSAPAAFSTEEGLLPVTAVDPQASLPATLSPGPITGLPAEYIDAQGVAMALVPAGEFMMGSENGASDERPVHAVYLDAFYIDLYEVTNALYDSCVLAGACSQPQATSYYQDSNYSQHPVVYVDWSQAREYCRWRGGDLPTEAQWEKAARGGLVGKPYPWGDEAPVCEKGARNGARFDDNAACDDSGSELGGSFRPNGYGLYDMVGNVWEWVRDWYLDTYYSSSPPENPTGPAYGTYRALRGGSWVSSVNALRVASRNYIVPGSWDDNIGFRCAFSP